VIVTASLARVTDPLLSDVNNRHIAEMSVDPLRGMVRLRLVMGEAGNDDIFLTLQKVAYISTACNPDDIKDLDALAFIADLSFYSLVDGGAAILASLNYPILNLEGGVRTYPGTLLYYIHMEGDICADIVCGSYCAGSA
jgi:hypothetical protein